MVTLLEPFVDETSNVQSVPISTTEDPNDFRVIYSVYVPNMQPGDVVWVQSQLEVTAGYKYNVGVGRFIVRTDSPTNVSGTPVVEAVMTNLSSGQNSMVVVVIGVDSDMPAGDYYYNVVAYAAADRAQPGDVLNVPQGYGDCTALVFERS